MRHKLQHPLRRLGPHHLAKAVDVQTESPVRDLDSLRRTAGARGEDKVGGGIAPVGTLGLRGNLAEVAQPQQLILVGWVDQDRAWDLRQGARYSRLRPAGVEQSAGAPRQVCGNHDHDAAGAAVGSPRDD